MWESAGKLKCVDAQTVNPEQKKKFGEKDVSRNTESQVMPKEREHKETSKQKVRNKNKHVIS